MTKDYYGVLGLDSDATQEEIKSAYRERAKRLHPDHYGQDCEPFRDVQEAYECLSDLERRRTYDDEMARTRRRQATIREVNAEPLRYGQCPVEPLVPSARPSYRVEPSRWRFGTFLSPFEDPFERVWNGLGALNSPWLRRREQVEVRLTRREARRGGQIRFSIPVQTACPVCAGRGDAGFSVCGHCLGSGRVAESRSVDIPFPRGTPDGYTLAVSLEALGIYDLDLIVHITVFG